jgi:hypothetical protein
MMLEGTCEVFINNSQVPDGSDGLIPAALSGLQVSWGRDNTIDQPEAATCTFDIMLTPEGTLPWGISLAVGSSVDVRATTQVDNTGVDAVFDPTFSNQYQYETTRRVESTPSSLEVAWSNTARTAGTKSLALTWTSTTTTGQYAYIAPALFSKGSGAWRYLPANVPGEAFTVGAWVRGVPGGKGYISLSVWDVDGTRGGSPGGAYFDLTGEWQYVSRTMSTGTASATANYRGAIIGATLGWRVTNPVTTAPPGWPSSQDVKTLLVDSITVEPPATTHPSAAVFMGRITSLKTAWSDDVDAPVLRVTCDDSSVDLENTTFGDAPWMVQSWKKRFENVLNIVDAHTVLGIGDTVYPSTIPDVEMVRQDVDAKQAMPLLREVAISVDATCWLTFRWAMHSYQSRSGSPLPFFLLEDPNDRAPFGRMVEGHYDLDACHVLRDGAEWAQDTGDLSTRVSVTWTDDVTDPEKETQRTSQIFDTAAEEMFGRRRVSISTKLRTENDALRVATNVLNRTRFNAWRLGGFTIDPAALNITPQIITPSLTRMFYLLLHGHTRTGLPLRLGDLPPWSPVQNFGAYIEGGKYTYEGGSWTLDLEATRAPALKVTNLLPNPQPSSAAYWYTSGGGTADVTFPTGAPGGGTYYRHTQSGASTVGGWLYAMTPANQVNVVGGQYYTISVDLIIDFQDPSKVTRYAPYFAFYASATAMRRAATDPENDEGVPGEDIGPLEITPLAALPADPRARAPEAPLYGTIGPFGQWYRARQRVRAPLNMTYASTRLAISDMSGAVAGDFYGATNFVVSADDTSWPFHGDTPDMLGVGYDWTAGQDSSPSTMTLVEWDAPPPVYQRTNLARSPHPQSDADEWRVTQGTATVRYNEYQGIVLDIAEANSTQAAVRVGISGQRSRVLIEPGKTYAISGKTSMLLRGTCNFQIYVVWHTDTGSWVSTQYVTPEMQLTGRDSVERVFTCQATAPTTGNPVRMTPYFHWTNPDGNWQPLTSNLFALTAGKLFVTDNLDDSLAYFDGLTPSTAITRYTYDHPAGVPGHTSSALYLGDSAIPIDIMGTTPPPYRALDGTPYGPEPDNEGEES